jgi:hypothetical protein
MEAFLTILTILGGVSVLWFAMTLEQIVALLREQNEIGRKHLEALKKAKL